MDFCCCRQNAWVLRFAQDDSSGEQGDMLCGWLSVTDEHPLVRWLPKEKVYHSFARNAKKGGATLAVVVLYLG